jgi:hypothetical protein
VISALVSFLGGSIFRTIWGELSVWITARQDHAHEIERMRLQGDLDAAAHARNLDAIRVRPGWACKRSGCNPKLTSITLRPTAG